MEPVVVTRLTVNEMIDAIVPRLARQLLDALTDEDPGAGDAGRRKPSADQRLRSKRQRRSCGTSEIAR